MCLDVQSSDDQEYIYVQSSDDQEYTSVLVTARHQAVNYLRIEVCSPNYLLE